MKRILALILALSLVACLFVGCAPAEPVESSKAPEDSKTDVPEESKDDPAPAVTDFKVAMITDYGDITDQSFNQTTYEACKAFADEYSVPFQYYKPTSNDTAGRVASMELAIAEGYNILVLPGFAFNYAIMELAPNYPDVKFFTMDIDKAAFLEAGVVTAGEEWDWNPDNWDFDKYVKMDNVYSAIYQEEVSGYMAGFAAVKMGFTKLGFLGGMPVPAVLRFGHGYVQGVNDAAAELGITVDLKYVYGGQFFGDADITAVMDTWYADGTEVVFACGGGIFTSACEAALKANGKVIGVDVDQSGIIDGGYAPGMTVTSATKGLAPTVVDTLTDICINNNWAEYAGKIEVLGLVSAEDPTLNYVQLPVETTQWNDTFTKDDYVALVAKILNGEIQVTTDTVNMPEVTNVNIEDLGSIKG